MGKTVEQTHRLRPVRGTSERMLRTMGTKLGSTNVRRLLPVLRRKSVRSIGFLKPGGHEPWDGAGAGAGAWAWVQATSMRAMARNRSTGDAAMGLLEEAIIAASLLVSMCVLTLFIFLCSVCLHEINHNTYL
jgi:hypothetical protein